MPVKTAKVQRRALEFADYEQLLAEVHRLSSGKSRQLGNWSLGQVCEHLALSMDMAIDGAPFKAPFFVRWIGPYFKQRILTQPMSAGFRLPKRGAALLPGDREMAVGVMLLERAITRLQRTAIRQPHFVFGPLTVEEWDRLQLKHAAMHLSFIELE